MYSDDEEEICKNFTRDFYKLVNIHKSDSLQSQLNVDDKTVYLSSDDESNTSSSGRCHENGHDNDDSADDSPTPSEAGRAQVFSCSSTTTSESDDTFSVKINNLSNVETKDTAEQTDKTSNIVVIDAKKYNVLESAAVDETGDEDVVVLRGSSNKMNGRSPMSRRNARNSNISSSCRKIVKEAKVQPCMSWRRSNGWTRVSGQSKVS